MRIRALLCALVLPLAAHAASTSLTFNPPAGVPARGKHVVFVSILDERMDDFNRKVFVPQDRRIAWSLRAGS